MDNLHEIRVEQPLYVFDWTPQDQEILEWMFPSLHEPPRPLTPDCPEPARLYRTRALSQTEWDDLMSVV